MQDDVREGGGPHSAHNNTDTDAEEEQRDWTSLPYELLSSVFDIIITAPTGGVRKHAHTQQHTQQNTHTHTHTTCMPSSLLLLRCISWTPAPPPYSAPLLSGAQGTAREQAEQSVQSVEECGARDQHRWVMLDVCLCVTKCMRTQTYIYTHPHLSCECSA